MRATQPGTSFGVRDGEPDRYLLIRRLGRGGMGEVFLARDQTLGREVAIKFLTAEDGDATRRRLLREAQSAAAFDHPGICTVHEVGETADGRGFIVMQFVQGETLAARLERGPLPVREALALAAQVADALGAAHRHGIVHRDLKPQNVIVMPSGRVKLVDFGLARPLPLAPADDAQTRSVDTVAGVLVGTPAYMSPEQVQQRTIDGRSDLFALGAVLFECLTGARAFRGENTYDTIGQILRGDPPAVSTLRPELDWRHDELCRRLLAKNPADRFQSADEVLGAIRLLGTDSAGALHPGSGTVAAATGATAPLPASGSAQLPQAGPALRIARARRWWLAVLAASAVVLALAGWRWLGPRPQPPVPADAARWYERGVEALREGAYRSGQLALEEAIRLHVPHALAHARLAEAFAELDDERAAQRQLLRLASLVSDESRLPDDERLRITGTRALVLRDVDAAVAAYRALAALRPQDATAWFDLGRAQEVAGDPAAAAASYAQALAIDPQFAAAHLRVGSIRADESQRDRALAAFAEAERLYRSAANVEGETEVLLQRGSFRDGQSEFEAARRDLERALALATPLDGTQQIVRAQLALGSVTASQGRLTESERLASSAVETALARGLDTVAANGLIDLAATLQSGQLAAAASHAERALQVADGRGARRTAARARLQLAAIRTEQRRPAEAVALAEQALGFLGPNRYRRLELDGLSILARAYEQQGDLERARTTSAQVLAAAEAGGNAGQLSQAMSHLASLATVLGRLPEALAMRERAEAVRRAQGDASALPYDLANRAELLIRLGRFEQAEAPLAELEAGIAAGVDSYVGRARRVTFLRGLAAVMARRHEDAIRLLARLQPFEPDGSSVGGLGPAVYEFAAACTRGALAGRRAPAARQEVDVEAVLAREREFWRAAAALQRGEPRVALEHATRGLDLLGSLANDELRWRLAAVGAVAARQLGTTAAETDMRARMARALEQLRANWPGGLGDYEKRPDLVELRTSVDRLTSREAT